MHTDLDEHLPLGRRRNKVVSAAEAVRLIHDGDTVATGGFVGIGFAEEIAIALKRVFWPPRPKPAPDRPRASRWCMRPGKAMARSAA